MKETREQYEERRYRYHKSFPIVNEYPAPVAKVEVTERDVNIEFKKILEQHSARMNYLQKEIDEMKQRKAKGAKYE